MYFGTSPGPPTPATPPAPASPRTVLVERRERLIRDQKSLRENSALTTFGGIGGTAGAIAFLADGVLTVGIFLAVFAVGFFVVRWGQARHLSTVKSDLDYLETVQLLEEDPS